MTTRKKDPDTLKSPEPVAETPKKRGRPAKAVDERQSTIRWKGSVRITDNPVNLDIHRRFFQALDHLVKIGRLPSLYAFGLANNINVSNFYTMRDQPEKTIISALYINFLVTQYRVSAHWLVTGEGDMLNPQ